MRYGILMLAAMAGCAGSDGKGGTDDSGATAGSSADGFSEAFADAACDAQIACNADVDIIDAACDPPDTTSGRDLADCDFDADYAADCLDEEWTCTSIYGVTYAEVPNVCLLVLDCPPIVDTGTTGDDDDDDTWTAPNQMDDATLEAGVQCSGSTVAFSFDFLGDAVQGLVDAADSQNLGNWNDYHSLDASAFTSNGGYTLLSKEVDVGASVGDWAEGVRTVFTCADHFDSPGVMSYIVRAYDLNTALADCVAFGEDPAGMIDGDYFNYNAPIASGEFAGCRTAAAAR